MTDLATLIRDLGKALCVEQGDSFGFQGDPLPDGSAAPCESKCPRRQFRRMTRALSSDEKHANRIVTTCLGTCSETEEP